MIENIKQLHDRDFNLWIEETKKAIQNRDFQNMDWDNLLDEIDDMGKSEKRSLESYLQRLIEHLLKIQYWESERERNYQHWRSEVINFRKRIKRLVKANPSFKPLLEEIFPEILQDAIEIWEGQFSIPTDVKLTLVQTLDPQYFRRL
jgi:Domain of unknown function DUF29